MSEYLFLIYTDEARSADADRATFEATLAAHREFQQRNAAAIKGGDALQFTDAATAIRPDGSGGFTVTDGPFAETKEVLGGYYRIEAADLDEAMALAKQIPMPFGGVEIRPIRVLD